MFYICIENCCLVLWPCVICDQGSNLSGKLPSQAHPPWQMRWSSDVRIWHFWRFLVKPVMPMSPGRFGRSVRPVRPVNVVRLPCHIRRDSSATWWTGDALCGPRLPRLPRLLDSGDSGGFGDSLQVRLWHQTLEIPRRSLVEAESLCGKGLPWLQGQFCYIDSRKCFPMESAAFWRWICI